MGLVPKQIKAENKLGFLGLTVNRLLGLMLAYVVSSMLATFVHSSLSFLFQLFCIGVYLLMGIRAPFHPKQKLWQGLLAFLKFYVNPRRYYTILSHGFLETKRRYGKND